MVGASSWNSARSAPASPSVASTATSGGDGRGGAGEARPVDREPGDGGLQAEPLQHGLGGRGRDGGDDVGARREALGATGAAQRRPAAEEGGDDGRRRLAQRDGARAGLVGVEHVDGVESAAHQGEADAGRDGDGNRHAAGGGAGRDGQRRARRRPPAARAATGSARRLSPRARAPQPTASLQQQCGLAGRREDDHLVAALREGAGQRRPVVVRLARAIPGVRRDEADAHPDGSVSGSAPDLAQAAVIARTPARARWSSWFTAFASSPNSLPISREVRPPPASAERPALALRAAARRPTRRRPARAGRRRWWRRRCGRRRRDRRTARCAARCRQRLTWALRAQVASMRAASSGATGPPRRISAANASWTRSSASVVVPGEPETVASQSGGQKSGSRRSA